MYKLFRLTIFDKANGPKWFEVSGSLEVSVTPFTLWTLSVPWSSDIFEKNYLFWGPRIGLKICSPSRFCQLLYKCVCSMSRLSIFKSNYEKLESWYNRGSVFASDVGLIIWIIYSDALGKLRESDHFLFAPLYRLWENEIVTNGKFWESIDAVKISIMLQSPVYSLVKGLGVLELSFLKARL